VQHVMRHAKAAAERAAPSGKDLERTTGENRIRMMRVNQAEITERTREQRAGTQRTAKTAPADSVVSAPRTGLRDATLG